MKKAQKQDIIQNGRIRNFIPIPTFHAVFQSHHTQLVECRNGYRIPYSSILNDVLFLCFFHPYIPSFFGRKFLFLVVQQCLLQRARLRGRVQVQQINGDKRRFMRIPRFWGCAKQFFTRPSFPPPQLKDGLGTRLQTTRNKNFLPKNDGMQG